MVRCGEERIRADKFGDRGLVGVCGGDGGGRWSVLKGLVMTGVGSGTGVGSDAGGGAFVEKGL